MTMLSIFADIAGSVRRDVRGGIRMTAAAVAIRATDATAIRENLVGTPKWAESTPSNVAHAACVLSDRTVGMAVLSIRKDTEAWQTLWNDFDKFRRVLNQGNGGVPGFAMLGNLVPVYLLLQVIGMAQGHAIGIGSAPSSVDSQGRRLFQIDVICDSDIQGAENIELFKEHFRDEHQPTKALGELGVRINMGSVEVRTEQQEPLLLMPDYLAGIAHAALTENTGRLQFPLPGNQAMEIFVGMRRTGKLVIADEPFDLTFDTLFGEQVTAAIS